MKFMERVKQNLNWKGWKPFVNDANTYLSDNLNFAETMQMLAVCCLLVVMACAYARMPETYLFQVGVALIFVTIVKTIIDAIFKRGRQVFVVLNRPVIAYFTAAYFCIAAYAAPAMTATTDPVVMLTFLGTMFLSGMISVHMGIDHTWFEAVTGLEKPLKIQPNNTTTKPPDDTQCNPSCP